MGGPKDLGYLETSIVEEIRAEYARKSLETQQQAKQKAEELRQEMVRRGEMARKSAERALLLTEATKVAFQSIQRMVPHQALLHPDFTDEVIRELRARGASDALIRDSIAMAIAAGYGFTATVMSTQSGILLPPKPRSDTLPPKPQPATLGGTAKADAGVLRIKAEMLEVKYLEARRMRDQKGMQAAMEAFVGLLNQAKTAGDQEAAKGAAAELAKALEAAQVQNDRNSSADGRERVGGAPLEVPPSHQGRAPRREPMPPPRAPGETMPPLVPPRSGPYR